MPQITIGVPFYNCEAYLLSTIRSIYSQSFTDWEAIFVDDGSTDASLSVVESVNDDRVRVYSDGANRGIGARRKQIVDLARGQYLAWLDGDDMMHPDRLGAQFEFLENHPDIDCVDSSTFIIDPSRSVVRIDRRAEGIVPPSSMAVTPQMQNTVTTARTEMYRQVPFDPTCRRVEDWDVWIRASKRYTFYHMSAFLGYHLDADASQKPRLDRELTEPRHLMRTFLRYGAEYLGLGRCIVLTARLTVRTLYRLMMIMLGQHRYFKAIRENPVTPQDVAASQEGIDRILSARVPGIDL